MLPYCLKCRKGTKSLDAKMIKRKNGRLTISSKCAVCDSKKSRFIKEQESKGLLSSSEIRTPLNKIPLLNVLF